MSIINGAVLLLIAVGVVALVLEAIVTSPKVGE